MSKLLKHLKTINKIMVEADKLRRRLPQNDYQPVDEVREKELQTRKKKWRGDQP